MKKSIYQYENVSAMFEKLVEQFGPYESWNTSSNPDKPGTIEHNHYVAFCTIWHIQFNNKSPAATHMIIQKALFCGEDEGTENWSESDWRLHYLVKSCATDAGFITGRGVSKGKIKQTNQAITKEFFETLVKEIHNFEPEGN